MLFLASIPLQDAAQASDQPKALRGVAPSAAQAMLSPREIEVLTWVARGKSAREIGRLLAISKRTADEHAGAAVRKLGARNRTHAVAIALSRGLIGLDR